MHTLHLYWCFMTTRWMTSMRALVKYEKRCYLILLLEKKPTSLQPLRIRNSIEPNSGQHWSPCVYTRQNFRNLQLYFLNCSWMIHIAEFWRWKQDKEWNWLEFDGERKIFENFSLFKGSQCCSLHLGLQPIWRDNRNCLTNSKIFKIRCEP